MGEEIDGRLSFDYARRENDLRTIPRWFPDKKVMFFRPSVFLHSERVHNLGSTILDSFAYFPFEKFDIYDEFVEATLQSPDEVFKRVDEEGDNILTYIKAHELNGISFYYFCICMKFETHWGQDTETVIPIISFPSLDGELYRKYRSGDLITGNLKN